MVSSGVCSSDASPPSVEMIPNSFPKCVTPNLQGSNRSDRRDGAGSTAHSGHGCARHVDEVEQDRKHKRPKCRHRHKRNVLQWKAVNQNGDLVRQRQGDVAACPHRITTASVNRRPGESRGHVRTAASSSSTRCSGMQGQTVARTPRQRGAGRRTQRCTCCQWRPCASTALLRSPAHDREQTPS